MDNDHGITDEMRHYIEGAEQLYGRGCPRLTAMCDRIDAAHKKAMDDSYRDGYQEGKRDGDDEWYEEHESYLEEHGWYQALDADKAPIRIGDKVDSDHHEDGTVMGVQFYEMPRGIRTLVAVRPDGWDVATWHTPDEYHHHAPTVEDVLREFAGLVRKEHVELATIGENTIAEYAAKLQLRGDA